MKQGLKEQLPRAEFMDYHTKIMIKIDFLPTLSQFVQEKVKQQEQLNVYVAKYEQQIDSVNRGLKIIQRYDEVICEKAQKHALVELKNELQQQI